MHDEMIYIHVFPYSGFCFTFPASYLFKTDTGASGDLKRDKIKDPWSFKLFNPFKGRFGSGYLTKEQEDDISTKVSDFVLYDAVSAQSLDNFDVIKENTECLFAKRARLWGSPPYDTAVTLGKWKVMKMFVC